MNIANILTIIGITALFLLEGFFEVALLSFVGAFTRRAFGSKQKSFKEYYKENKIFNSIVGLISMIVLIAISVGITKVLAS